MKTKCIFQGMIFVKHSEFPTIPIFMLQSLTRFIVHVYIYHDLPNKEVLQPLNMTIVFILRSVAFHLVFTVCQSTVNPV